MSQDLRAGEEGSGLKDAGKAVWHAQDWAQGLELWCIRTAVHQKPRSAGARGCRSGFRVPAGLGTLPHDWNLNGYMGHDLNGSSELWGTCKGGIGQQKVD